VGHSENDDGPAVEVKNERMWRTSVRSALIAWSLALLAVLSSTAQPDLRRPLVVFIFGPPGSGKTTQAAALSKKYGIPAISMSKLLEKQLAKRANSSKLIKISVAGADLLGDAAATWTNRYDVPHTVVITGKKFSSPVLNTDQAFSFRFQEPGSYPCFCKIHPMMTGTIVVEKDASNEG
jgi:AAA domain-containing protein